MKKLLKTTVILLIITVVMVACGSKSSVPSEKKIKEDLVKSGQAHSVEKIEIIDTINQKSTLGMLQFTVNIDYTNKDMENKQRDSANIYYNWTDNDGWRIGSAFI